MRKTLNFILLSFTMVVFSSPSFAQDDPDADTQQWNDIQVTTPINEKVDLQFTGTFRFTEDISVFDEGRAGIGLIVKPREDLTFSTLYQNMYVRDASGEFNVEHRFDGRVTYKFPVEHFGLSHRSTIEYRIREQGNSWRYRPSLTLEKELKFIPKSKVFVTNEIFYDSNAGEFSRNRFSVGINKTLNKNLSLDIYYLRQNDGFSEPGDLNVIGTSWKINF